MLSVLLFIMKTKIRAKLNAFVHKPCSLIQHTISLHIFFNFTSYLRICPYFFFFFLLFQAIQLQSLVPLYLWLLLLLLLVISSHLIAA